MKSSTAKCHSHGLSPFPLPRIAGAFKASDVKNNERREEKADGRDDDVDQDDDCPLDEKRDVFHALRPVRGEGGVMVRCIPCGWPEWSRARVSVTLSLAFRRTEPHTVATGSRAATTAAATRPTTHAEERVRTLRPPRFLRNEHRPRRGVRDVTVSSIRRNGTAK
ncbi:hypothetical protein MTO96_031601 [Rhipicephalus appendiculatus]